MGQRFEPHPCARPTSGRHARAVPELPRAPSTPGHRSVRRACAGGGAEPQQEHPGRVPDRARPRSHRRLRQRHAHHRRPGQRHGHTGAAVRTPAVPHPRTRGDRGGRGVWRLQLLEYRAGALVLANGQMAHPGSNDKRCFLRPANDTTWNSSSPSRSGSRSPNPTDRDDYHPTYTLGCCPASPLVSAKVCPPERPCRR